MSSCMKQVFVLMVLLALTFTPGCSREETTLHHTFTLDSAEPRIALELRNIIGRASDVVVKVEEVFTNKVVLISAPMGEPLLIILPPESLSPEQSSLARRLFAGQSPKIDPEGGVRLQVEREAFEAAALVMRVLRVVYQLDESAELTIGRK